jgi:hypothetical protein
MPDALASIAPTLCSDASIAQPCCGYSEQELVKHGICGLTKRTNGHRARERAPAIARHERRLRHGRRRAERAGGHGAIP